MSTYDRDVAIAIGYHFWHCENDDAAEQCGKACAMDVAKRVGSQPWDVVTPSATAKDRP